MIVLSCSNISISFGEEKILENISFNLKETDRAGLIGVNGAGKSTLFKIIAGILHPDSGQVFIAKNSRLGYLEQNFSSSSENTIWDELISSYSHLIDMEQRLRQLEEKMSKEKDAGKLNSLMKEYSSVGTLFSNSGGYEYKSKTKGILRGLGFSEDEFKRKINTLSGGQKTRLSLAKLLLEQPDILLLDEPTNYLDINALEWLESFLKSYNKAVLVISHDRYFLDAVTGMTIELENSECKIYQGNYSNYIDQKSKDREIQQKHYELQQKEIARMEAFIEQQRRWNRERNIVAAESRQKAIDRMEKISRPKGLPEKVRFTFRSGVASGNDVLFVENLTMGFPGKQLFKNINFKLNKSERAFILGPNGCGKSTLLKLIIGELDPVSGTVEYGHNVRTGYYDQELSGLDGNSTVMEEAWSGNEKLSEVQVRNTLASFLFKGEDVFKKISCLSGGEKSRVALVKLILSGSNFLILDEPTNHLDINSREVLEKALTDFDGTILAISHDRYFINKLSTRILEIENRSIVDFTGNYYRYLDWKNKYIDKQDNTDNGKAPSLSKIEYLESKEQKARYRWLEKKLQDTEMKINQAEDSIDKISTEMNRAATDHIRLTQLHEEKTRLESDLENLYSLWESLMNEKETWGHTSKLG
jgi:ATP-binding cassette subfamily F protein 3